MVRFQYPVDPKFQYSVRHIRSVRFYIDLDQVPLPFPILHGGPPILKRQRSRKPRTVRVPMGRFEDVFSPPGSVVVIDGDLENNLVPPKIVRILEVHQKDLVVVLRTPQIESGIVFMRELEVNSISDRDTPRLRVIPERPVHVVIRGLSHDTDAARRVGTRLMIAGWHAESV